MKMLAEYLENAIKFEQMAAEEKDATPPRRRVRKLRRPASLAESRRSTVRPWRISSASSTRFPYRQIAAQCGVVHIINEQRWKRLDERSANPLLKLGDITAGVKCVRRVAESNRANCSNKQSLAAACTRD